MSFDTKIAKIRVNLLSALDSYSKDLAEAEKGELHNLTGVERKSVKVKEIGRWEREVGVDKAELLRLQWNVHKIDYASLDIGGHKQSNPVPFTKRIPNSSDSSYSGGYWWYIFPATSGYKPITTALNSMKSFKSYYKGVK